MESRERERKVKIDKHLFKRLEDYARAMGLEVDDVAETALKEFMATQQMSD